MKVFPASAGGPGHIKDVLAPLPQVLMVPSGGVNVKNAAEDIKAGAAAVEVGSSLVSRDLVAAGEFTTLTNAARRLVAAVRQARSQ